MKNFPQHVFSVQLTSELNRCGPTLNFPTRVARDALALKWCDEKLLEIGERNVGCGF